MKPLLVAVLLVLGVGCGSSHDNPEAKAAPAPTKTAASPERTYVQSDACRTGAAKVVAILDQAVNDTDVRDVASRMLAIEQLGSEPTATCTPAVASTLREAVFAMNCALDLAMKSAGMDRAPAPTCPKTGARAIEDSITNLGLTKSELYR